MAPQRNHTDSVITFYNRDTEKARDKMGNKTKKFRQISTKAHRTGHRRKSKERALPRVERTKVGQKSSKNTKGAVALTENSR